MRVIVTEASVHEPEPTKGSRFVASVVPVSSPAQARAAIEEIRARWPDATHHCWAWRLAPGDRHQSSDDGEPGGSAGRPILAQLVGHDAVDVLVVVSRWFGGTKLGVGGLVRAYGGAAGQALDRAATAAFVPREAMTITHGYEDAARVDGVLRREDVEAVDAEYGAAVRRTVLVPVVARETIAAQLRDATSGRVEIE